MPKPYPKEFRDDVVNVARNREQRRAQQRAALEALATQAGSAEEHPELVLKQLRAARKAVAARRRAAAGA